MQTLKRRTSPCKYKNDPSRFLGEGITFKAKLIGILEVSEARGDKMCQDALNDLKTAIRAAGEHKQRITINISIDGLRLRDEKTGDCLYHHPVHKISFIAQDMSDSRAFGYIFGSPDTGHRFFGIKTDKTASQVVISMRDLFQVVFELKKKEIEMAKHHPEQHHVKYGTAGYMDSIHFAKDDGEFEKGKGKYSQLLKSKCLTGKSSETGCSESKGATSSEAVADLLDLEHGGINRSDASEITSDPFGSLSRPCPYDPFDDSFSSKPEKPMEEKVSSSAFVDHSTEESSNPEGNSTFFASTTASKVNFLSQFSSGMVKSEQDDGRWFERETESLFDESANGNSAEPTSSPMATNAADAEQVEGKKSPVKTDLFTELDPLGTGRVKPYVDKKDFFQELKNPPKKVLKELITDGVSIRDHPSLYFPAHFKEGKKNSSKVADLVAGSESEPKYSRTDPFDDGDPFEKTDPFREDNFPISIAFPPLFGIKSSSDGFFEEKTAWKFDEPNGANEIRIKSSPTKSFPLFSPGVLRVSLPPEKPEVESSKTKSKSPPNSPEDAKAIRRKLYQSLQEKGTGGGSPVREEPFVRCKLTNFEAKFDPPKKSPFKDKFYPIRSPPPDKTEVPRPSSRSGYSSVEILDATTPDPPPRTKTALFSIKPPPLPPKKSVQPASKPPARPPSLDDQIPHYDYLQRKDGSGDAFSSREELKCVKLKKNWHPIGKESISSNDSKGQNSESGFPVLLPPPARKSSSGEGSKNISSERKQDAATKTIPTGDGLVLNLKLTQLDGTGLENLAASLGIPFENIYKMTLQDLTKMLAEKYSTGKTEGDESRSANGSFEADFDSNFAKPEVGRSADPTYDKYAAFKELIQETESSAGNDTGERREDVDAAEKADSDRRMKKEVAQKEEDKYEALRQLSLNVQKESEVFEGVEMSRESALPPATSLRSETAGNQNGGDDGRPSEGSKREGRSDAEKVDWASKAEWTKSSEFGPEARLFPRSDQFSGPDDGNSPSAKENWATFEKPDSREKVRKRSFNENENSPFSSDGREEEREVSLRWSRTGFGRKEDKEGPWEDDEEEGDDDDEEESWDDYSPGESLCSDESSREERSPEMSKRENRYAGKSFWGTLGRSFSKERSRSDRSDRWTRRDHWPEETEDEFGSTWRKRTGSHDASKKKSRHEEYGKRYENWGEAWEEDGRRSFGSRRKRSESDSERRKRCDSDASDRECIWTFQKTLRPETRSRTLRQKKYQGQVRSFGDGSERCHESRSRQRKGISQKRASSASESRRIYEKMTSPADYPFEEVGDDPILSGKEEFFRFRRGWKNFRHRSEQSEFDRHRGCDGKMATTRHSRASGKGSGGFGGFAGRSEIFQSPFKRSEGADAKNDNFDYPETFGEKRKCNSKNGSADESNRFRFDGEMENFERKICGGSPVPRTNRWASANGKTEGGEEFSSPSRKSIREPEVRTPEDADGSRGRERHSGTKSGRPETTNLLKKSDSVNIFSRDKDPFEGDDFFSNAS